MAEPADPRLGSEIAGYRIEGRIGRGGMGVVYRAEHMNLQRRAAIKIIAPEVADTRGFRSRFIHEARIAAALQHPNIVTVYDAGQAGETLYIAMQFIRGSDLAATLRQEGRLRPYRAIDVCRQVASALDAAHGMALIHRDVKPGNVLIEGVEPSTCAIVQVTVGDRIEVELADAGQDVFEAARDRHPDAIVLDWHAAQLAARAILEALRADPVTRESQVLLIVRHKQTRSRGVARADADETLATPFSPLQLQVKLRKLLGAHAVAV